MSYRFATASMLAVATLLVSASATSQSADAGATASLPATLRASAGWAAGEKQTYQVQQSLKQRGGGKEETRFLANGQVEVTATEVTADRLRFTWHRRMDNGEFELVREPWGIRGNAPYEKLLTTLVRDGLPLQVVLNLRTHKARIENRDEIVQILKRRLQGVGGEFLGNRSRVPLPGESRSRESGATEPGFVRPLVRYNDRVLVNSPGNAGSIAYWYARLATTEIEDFLGVLGRDFRLEDGSPVGNAPLRSYRPAGAGELLLSVADAPMLPEAGAEPAAPEAAKPDRQGDEKAADITERSPETGLLGGEARPVAYEGKIELSIPSGWPKRAAILRSESSEGNDSQRTVLRRVYLRQ